MSPPGSAVPASPAVSAVPASPAGSAMTPGTPGSRASTGSGIKGALPYGARLLAKRGWVVDPITKMFVKPVVNVNPQQEILGFRYL